MACAVWNIVFHTALPFNANVKLDRLSDTNIILHSIGIASKAKEAREEAIKNAFRTLFYDGIPGLSDGIPLLTEKNKSFDYRFFDSQYPKYINSDPTIISDEKHNGQRHVVLEVSINIEKLKKAALSGGCNISPRWETSESTIPATSVTSMAIRPSIVVIPAMQNPDADFEAMAEYVKDNSIIESAINAVATNFSKMGYTTKDFATLLQNSKTAALTSSSAQTDVITELVRQLPGDVVVSVDAEIDSNGELSSCRLYLKAIERQTGDQLALQEFISGRYRSSDFRRLVTHAVDKMPDDFFHQLDNSFQNRIKDGVNIIVEFQLGSSVSDWDFDSPLTSSEEDFKSWLSKWMRENCIRNSYTNVSATDKFIRCTMKIPLWDSTKNQAAGTDTFATSLKSSLLKALDNEYGVKVTEMGQRLIITIE